MSTKLQQPLLLATKCQHCGQQMISLPAIGWAHIGNTSPIAQVSILCAGGAGIATHRDADPVSHTRITLAPWIAVADLVQNATPMPVPWEVFDEDGMSRLGLIVISIILVPFWTAVIWGFTQLF